MVFQVNINLPYPHLGFLFLFYWLLAYTPLPKYIKRGAIIYHRHSENRIYQNTIVRNNYCSDSWNIKIQSIINEINK